MVRVLSTTKTVAIKNSITPAAATMTVGDVRKAMTWAGIRSSTSAMNRDTGSASTKNT